MSTVTVNANGPSELEQYPEAAAASEKAVLGCILANETVAFPQVIKRGVGPTWFEDNDRRELYQTLLAMRREGSPIDYVTVFERIRGNDPDTANALLESLSAVTTSAHNVSYYFPELEASKLRRTVWKFATTMRQYSCTNMDATELAQSVESSFRGLFHTNGHVLPEMVDAAIFIAEPLPEPMQLIEGVLHQGSKLSLGGGSKSFKTWSLLDIALSVSHGVPWLGIPTHPGRVLYLNFEIPDWSWHHRIRTVAQTKGITIDPNKLVLWNLRGCAADFDTLLPQITARAKSGNFALIICDPIYKMYGHTDENKAGDVARLMNAIEAMTVATNAASAFGAHFSKGNQAGKETIDRVSGSGVFARDPDSILTFTKHETDGCYTVEMTLRNFAPIEPFVVSWHYPTFERDASLDPSKLKQVGGRKKEYSADQLLDVLGDKNISTSDWAKLAQIEAGIKERTFFTLKSELQKSKRVFQSAVTHCWTRCLTK